MRGLLIGFNIVLCGSTKKKRPLTESVEYGRIPFTIFSVVVGIFTIIGAVAATMSLIYYICDRNDRKKK